MIYNKTSWLMDCLFYLSGKSTEYTVYWNLIDRRRFTFNSNYGIQHQDRRVKQCTYSARIVTGA